MESQDTLIPTVGLPRAGKSTWITKMHQRHGWPVVEVDAVRDAIHGTHYNKQAEPLVWSHVRVMLRSLFRGHHDVVMLDSTMITEERRSMFVGENFRVAFKEFTTTPETCIERAEMTDQEYLVPVINRMDANRDPIGVDALHFEDWYEIYDNPESDYQELLDDDANPQ